MHRFYYILVLLLPALALADEIVYEQWKGTVELGGVIASGNSETLSAKAALKGKYDLPQWAHILSLETYASRNSGEDTAQRHLGEYQGRYKLHDERDYIFGSLRAERDIFSGFKYRLSESIGYGRKVWNESDLVLSFEIGPGFRQAKLIDDTKEDDLIVRASANYWQKISSYAELSEDLLVLAGENNTETSSVTAITAKIIEQLRLKVSLKVTHNTDVPLNTKKTDTLTSFSLLYSY